jgi:hypothetical protein
MGRINWNIIWDDDETDAERARAEERKKLARLARLSVGKPGTAHQIDFYRVESLVDLHVRGQGLLHVGPYNHSEAWQLPSWGDQPGVDAARGRHMPLHMDPDFNRYPSSSEFFGFGSIESLDRWFCPTFYPWLKRNLFCVRMYQGEVEAGYSQAVMNTSQHFSFVALVRNYAHG